MAQEANKLTKIDDLDPVSTAAGAGSDLLPTDEREWQAEEMEELEMTGEHPSETEQLKAQIEETRSQMGETIDAIQEKLSYENVSEKISEQVSNAIETAKDTVYDATIGKAVNVMKSAGNDISGSNFAESIKRHPVPYILIAAGTGLLAYNSFSGKNRSKKPRLYRVDDRESPADFSSKPSLLKSAGAKASSAASGAAGTIREAADTAYHGVTGAAETVASGANQIAHRAYDKAGALGTKVHETYDHYAEENPLALAAAAFAAGAVAGFAIPSTHFEGKVMGETRDEVLRKAQDAAKVAVDKATDVAGEAARTIGDEIRDAGH